MIAERPSLTALLALLAAVALPADALAVDFDRDVRPILSDACFRCHGPDREARRAGLRLDTRAGAFAPRDDGRPVIVAGDTAASELARRITASDPDERMPPASEERRLSDVEIATILKWIDEGATWREHWSFAPPRRRPPPDVRLVERVRGPIDAFVQARLEREGLALSEDAFRETLVRRVTLDITGLPPTPDEIDAFLADRRPDAHERLVDRLLASPRHGERMATPWLDAARYADTSGYQTDGPRDMWRWRDWVIDAFNAGMPFDRFTIEQLAGDMLPQPTLAQRIATGFNRNHRGNAEGGIIAEEYRVEYVADRVDTTATVWLGLTLQCARCHDHKYDPITQEEFYRVFAYFNNVPEHGRAIKVGNSVPWILAPTSAQREQLEALERRLAVARDEFTGLRALAGEPSAAPASEWLFADGLVTRHATGRTGAAALFDGARVVELGDAGAFGYFDAFSVAAWVLPESTASGAVVSRTADPEYDAGWEVRLHEGRVQVNLVKRWLDDAIRVETESQLAAGEWRHVIATYDGSRVAAGVAVFIDGERVPLRVLLDELNQSFDSKEPLRVGGRGVGERFRGRIDDVRVYARALTPDDARIIATDDTLAEIVEVPAGERSAGQRLKLERAWLELDAPDTVRSAWSRMRDLVEQRAALIDSFPSVMVMEETAPRETHVLVRGRYDRPAARVESGTPACLPQLPSGVENDRLGFARWIVDPANPLTPRVTANRLWQMLFGRGIVDTVEDFGSQGSRPTHPELLDWLATELPRAGWDLKTFLRTLVTSSVYRQSSRVTPALAERDPENRLLARAPRLRLSAHMARDLALAVSGLLVERIGGPSVKPYQPPGLWKEVSGTAYERDDGEGLYRRSLYTYWKRTVPFPTMTVLDASDREWCAVRSQRTNTPLQALALLNDVTFVEAARALAGRVLAGDATDEASRAAQLFRMATGRRPGAAEVAILLDGLRRHRVTYGDRALAAALLEVGESRHDPDIDASELAAWTALANLVLNLDETITRG